MLIRTAILAAAFTAVTAASVFASPVVFHASGVELYERFYRPGGWTLGSFDWNDGQTFPGWHAVYVTDPANPEGSATVPDVYRRNNGPGSSPIGFYLFRNGPGSEFGSLGTRHFNASSGPPDEGGIYFGLAVRNDTGGAISSFKLGYTGEQWRVSSGGPATFAVSYSTNAESLVSGNWTGMEGLEYASPRYGEASAVNTDGKAEANRVVLRPRTVELSDPLPPGGVLWLRWFSVNAPGIDQSVGIDEIRLTPNPGPLFNSEFEVGIDPDPKGLHWNYADRAVFIGDGPNGNGSLRVGENQVFPYYDLYLGVGHADTRGVLTLDGAGAQAVPGRETGFGSRLHVGEEGVGELWIRNGASLDWSVLEAGVYPGSEGSVTVTGAGSVLRAEAGTTGDLRLGKAGTGSLSVLDGAAVTGVNHLWVGAEGKGTLRVEGGGRVSTDGPLLLAGGPDSQGTAVASGEGTLLEIGGDLFIGAFGGEEPDAALAGEAGTSTVTVEGAAPSFHFAEPRHLTIGFHGADVEALQESLNFLGHAAGSVDGDFGRVTDLALRAFQTSAGIPAHGEFDVRTMVALDSALRDHGGAFSFERLPDPPDAGPTTLTMGALREGTAFETPVFTYEAAEPGPTLFMVGGIHGNEQSGHLALLDAIEAGITLSRGRLVLVPTFNKIAVEQNRRTLSRSGSALSGVDFNRMFPVGEEPTYLIAREIWDLISGQPNLEFVLDFHDGFINSLGNSMLRTGQTVARETGAMLVGAMEEIRPEDSVGAEWRPLGWPIDNSLIRKVGMDLEVPGILVELSGRTVGDPLGLRKDYVWRMIRILAREHGMTLGFSALGGTPEEEGGEAVFTVGTGAAANVAGDVRARPGGTLRLDGGRLGAGGILWAEGGLLRFTLDGEAAPVEAGGVALDGVRLEIELGRQPELGEVFTLVSNSGGHTGVFLLGETILFQGSRFTVNTGAKAAELEIDYGGGAGETDVTLTVVGGLPETPPYRRWIEEFPDLTPEERDPLANPSGDGFANALKFVLGLDPREPTQRGLPVPLVEQSGEGDWLVVDIPVNAEAVDCCGWANLVVESGSSLVVESWTPVGSEHVGLPQPDLLRVRMPVGEYDRRFVRLRVANPDAFR